MRTVLFAALILPLVTSGADDSDAIRARLDQARVAYEADMGRAKAALLSALQQKEDAAQKAGNLTLLKQVRDEREALDGGGTLPKSVGTTEYTAGLAKARKRMEAAFAQARKEYTQAGKLTDAETVDKDLEAFRRGPDDAPVPDLREAGRRVLWSHTKGYFVRGVGADWFEKWDDGKPPPNLFTETQRTAEFVELRHAHSVLVVRLYADRAVSRERPAGELRQIYEGKWRAPPK